MNGTAEKKEQQLVLPMWRAALYIRLSKEDGDKAESYSVTSQREILKEYLKLHPDIEPYDFYIDDGWSGTSFDRPGFARMLSDINSGAVNCVIVKDLSRFGRNYTDAGNYIDNIFVRLRVRFIALNNGVDTFSGNMNAATQCISVGVTNVINESLAATTSVNVRGTLNVNRRQGKFIGSFPTYGYLKDPNDHHKLIVDEDAAPIVRLIYEKFIGGRSIIGIAKDLNDSKIPNPSAYKRQKGMNCRHTSVGGSVLWPESTVRRILRNEMYIGNMVQGKNTTMSYKIKQCRAIPKSEWITVENTHEAIIDKDDFYKAQALFNRHIRTAPQKREADLFSGFVRCADCSHAMEKKRNVFSYGTYEYYRCVTHRKMSESACKSHSIRIDRLENAVLVTLQKLIETAVCMDEVLSGINTDERRVSEKARVEKALKKLEDERERYMRMLLELYPDWKNGVITREEYFRLKASLNEKAAACDSEITRLKKATAEYENSFAEENGFIAHFKKFGTVEKLTRPLLIELVEEILVHADGGITVNFKFRDEYKKAAEYVESAENSSKTA